MDHRHQEILIGVIVLILIINITLLYSFETGMGQPAASAQNKTNASLLKDAAVNVSTTKSAATPTATPKTTSAPAANASKAAPAATANAGSSAPSATAGFRTYTNASYTFSMDYPANWTVAEMTPALLKTTNATRPRSETGIRVVDFYSPAVMRCDDTNAGNCVYIRTRVSVDVTGLPANMTFEDYFINRTLAMTLDNSVGMRRSSPVVSLNNTKAYSLEYNSGYELNQAYVTKVFGLFNGQVYIITYRANYPKTGEVNQFYEYSDDFEHMIKSFGYTGPLTYL